MATRRVLIVGLTAAALTAVTAQTIAGPSGSTTKARNAALRQYGQARPPASVTPSASKKCVERAPFRLTLFRGRSVRSVRVLVNGRGLSHTKIRRGTRTSAIIRLRDAEDRDGVSVVRVRVRLRDGRKVSFVKRYKTCT